jgi:hypothetical protein
MEVSGVNPRLLNRGCDRSPAVKGSGPAKVVIKNVVDGLGILLRRATIDELYGLVIETPQSDFSIAENEH